MFVGHSVRVSPASRWAGIRPRCRRAPVTDKRRRASRSSEGCSLTRPAGHGQGEPLQSGEVLRAPPRPPSKRTETPNPGFHDLVAG